MIIYQLMAGYSGIWKEHNWKIVDKAFGGRGMCIDLSEWSKNTKIFVSYVNAHQRMTSAEEYINNQVDRLTHSVDTSQPLSSATTVISQCTDEQHGHGGRDGGLARAQQHGLQFAKADLLWPPLSAQSASSRDQH